MTCTIVSRTGDRMNPMYSHVLTPSGLLYCLDNEGKAFSFNGTWFSDESPKIPFQKKCASHRVEVTQLEGKESVCVCSYIYIYLYIYTYIYTCVSVCVCILIWLIVCYLLKIKYKLFLLKRLAQHSGQRYLWGVQILPWKYFLVTLTKPKLINSS